MLQSTYLKTSQANWIKGTAYPTAPTTLYVSLHNGDPLLTGANEITATVSTGRVALTASSSLSAIATSGTTRRRLINVDVSYGNATASGSATYWGLWDAATSGNFLGGARLLTTTGANLTLTITSGQEIFIGANSLIIGYSTSVFANYFIDKVLGWFGGTAFGTAPTNIWAGFATNPLSDGTGTYVAVDRETLTFGSNTTVDNYVQIANSTLTTFDDSTISATINGAGFFDAATSGNLIAVGRFPDLAIISGTPLFFTANTVRLQF